MAKVPLRATAYQTMSLKGPATMEGLVPNRHCADRPQRENGGMASEEAGLPRLAAWHHALSYFFSRPRRHKSVRAQATLPTFNQSMIHESIAENTAHMAVFEECAGHSALGKSN